jgi:hypothetical protein
VLTICNDTSSPQSLQLLLHIFAVLLPLAQEAEGATAIATAGTSVTGSRGCPGVSAVGVLVLKLRGPELLEWLAECVGQYAGCGMKG